MPKITIDQTQITCPDGITILAAARSASIAIPTLCHLEGIEPQTSCLVCVVRVNGSPRLVPACATRVAEGMVIESESPLVRKARRTALELLLAEHAGECFAPCSQVCPARLDIPEMMRQVRENDLFSAIVTARDALVLPATLGHICPGLCEKGCRRASSDQAVSICATHRFIAETDLAAANPYLPPLAPATGRRVAIVGAGPAGLAAAYDLARLGHACTVFDSHAAPGGTLRYGLEPGKLPESILDAEIALLARMGIAFKMNTPIPDSPAIDQLAAGFDALALTIVIPNASRDGIFLSASAASQRPHAVQAIADGKDLAVQVHAFLTHQPHAPSKRFAVRLGVLTDRELRQINTAGSTAPRTTPSAGPAATFTPAEAASEAERCMLCGCGSIDFCKLRRYATEYGAEPSRYRGDRRPIRRITSHPGLVFEEGKCISCGLCIAIARRAGEPMGLSFVGRGFAVTVSAPLGHSWSEALTKAAEQAAEACPTGAIHRRDAEKPLQHPS